MLGEKICWLLTLKKTAQSLSDHHRIKNLKKKCCEYLHRNIHYSVRTAHQIEGRCLIWLKQNFVSCDWITTEIWIISSNTRGGYLLLSKGTANHQEHLWSILPGGLCIRRRMQASSSSWEPWNCNRRLMPSISLKLW